MDSVSQFIEKRLKLKVNREKSAVDYPTNRKFLGFSFYCIDGVTRIRVHPKSLKRLHARLKELTGRSTGINMETRVAKLNHTIQGWVNYYKLANMSKLCQRSDTWLRRRLRMCYWKQWKKIGARHDNLVRLGISCSKAWEFANTRKGYWHIANSHILATTLTNEFFLNLGLSSLSDVYSKSLSLRTAVCRTARTVV
jgi:hypothetical protein